MINISNARPWGFACFFLLTLTLGVLTAIECAKPETAGRSKTASALPDQTAKARLLESYGQLPLSFEANRGQAGNHVKFVARGKGYSLYLKPDEVMMDLRNAGAAEAARVRMKIIGAGPQTRLAGEEKLPGAVNYFLGADPAKWRTGVSTFNRVRYDEVYAGTSLVFYGNQGQLEYDFIVAPGAKPNQISLRFDGAEMPRIEGNGDLAMDTKAGELRHRKPIIYQIVEGGRRTIEGGYHVRPDQTIGFTIGSYDGGKELIIDPVMAYSTLIGASSDDNCRDLTIDSAGNAYLVGYTTPYQSGQPSFPVTPGAYQPVNNGDADVFVAKLNSTGTALLYSTYLGGGYFDSGNGIAVDGEGNAYVTGSTSAVEVPNNLPAFPATPTAFQRNNAGARDAFLAKLSADGSTLLYSTLFGSAGSEEAFAIALGAAGVAYITGFTNFGNVSGASLPTTPAAYQKSYGGGISDSFVAAFSTITAGETGLLYSTLLGGSGVDDIFDIAVDANRNAYLTGRTLAPAFGVDTGFPVTPGAYQTVRGGSLDAFVAKLNSSGSALFYSTYIGTKDQEGAYGIAIDEAGQAYITGSLHIAGQSQSPAPFPTTPGAYQTERTGFSDAFLLKLNPQGSGLVFSTLIETGGFRIALDGEKNIYLASAVSKDDPPLPTTPGAFQTANAGKFDVYLMKLNSAGSALLFATYLGASDADFPAGLAVDAAGNIYVGGTTFSPDQGAIYPPAVQGGTQFPTTPGAIQRSNAGRQEVFVTKFEAPQPAYYNIAGRVTDPFGRAISGVRLTLTGSQAGSVLTDRGGYYSFQNLLSGGSYRVTPPQTGPTINFKTYYPNPGYAQFANLSGSQTANFAYNLTSPWVPPGATPTPTPTPAPTPTPTPPPPTTDGMILNPSFESGGQDWMTGGAVSFARGSFVTDGGLAARLTPTSIYSPASVFQWVRLAAGATYEVSADVYSDSRTRPTLSVKWDTGADGPSQLYNNSANHQVTLRFTIPAGVSQVEIYFKASGSVASGSWATADNFKLKRIL